MIDCHEDLIRTEQLTSFSVVESFCDVCGDLTPHHINDIQVAPKIDDPDAIAVPALSQHECVYCREDEENDLDEGCF